MPARIPEDISYMGPDRTVWRLLEDLPKVLVSSGGVRAAKAGPTRLTADASDPGLGDARQRTLRGPGGFRATALWELKVCLLGDPGVGKSSIERRFVEDKTIRRPVCLNDLEEPMQLKCGYTCCLQRVSSLQKEPHGEGVLCPLCPVASQKNDIKPKYELRALIAITKEREPMRKSALRMNPRMRKFQVDMTSDVDTASNCLTISEDPRSVRRGDFRRSRRGQAERFSSARCVLGTTRLTSGRHCWEVDVGTNKIWDVGICKESVNGQRDVVLSSELGFWTVGSRKGQIFAASTMPLTFLWVSPQLQRVGVYLDVGMRSISFYNVSDGCHIYTFNDIPVIEPLRPFFSHKRETQDDQSFLSICPVINPDSASPPVYSGERK
ncbi:ret finger protein-like 4A [Cebus imitator]|uniref:ret finger protein-like 4A n=1 Tax=Cebus imitator TaxID=2715852 RepID=UPI000809A11E|nr:ret finger protein-like 4A [Cebus imitator]